jgi:hypothetical protein
MPYSIARADAAFKRQRLAKKVEGQGNAGHGWGGHLADEGDSRGIAEKQRNHR